MKASRCATAITLGSLLLAGAHGAEITRSQRDSFGQTWSIHLATDEKVRLTNVVPSEGNSLTVSLRFMRSEAPAVEALLKKFLQWAALAEKNEVSAVEKEIGTVGETALTFRVESDERRIHQTLRVPGEAASLTPESGREFLKLLAQLPAMDSEMTKNKATAALLPDSAEEVARNEALGRRAELHARALESVRKRLAAAGPAQYSTLGPADDAFTSSRALQSGLWEARGVVQAKFDGATQRRSWAVVLRPRANDGIEIVSTEIKPLASEPPVAR